MKKFVTATMALVFAAVLCSAHTVYLPDTDFVLGSNTINSATITNIEGRLSALEGSMPDTMHLYWDSSDMTSGSSQVNMIPTNYPTKNLFLTICASNGDYYCNLPVFTPVSETTITIESEVYSESTLHLSFEGNLIQSLTGAARSCTSFVYDSVAGVWYCSYFTPNDITAFNSLGVADFPPSTGAATVDAWLAAYLGTYHSITIANNIVNGSISADKALAEQGETVNLSNTPDFGYALDYYTVNGDSIVGSSFSMPDVDVLVSAVFASSMSTPTYYFQFEEGASPTYAATSTTVHDTTSGNEIDITCSRLNRGTDAGDKVVGTYAMRLCPVSGTNGLFRNTSAFSSPATALSFQYAIYGTDTMQGFTVSTSSNGTDWTELVDLTSSATQTLQTYNANLPANTYYIKFENTSTVSGNTRRLDIDEIKIWTAQ